MLGRLVMVAFIGIFLFREFWSVEVESSSGTAAVIVVSLIMAATWSWFWLFIAAGNNYVAAGVAVAIMVTSATALVHVNHIGVFPFYYAVIVAGAAYKWHTSALLVIVVTVVALGVWWPQGQTDADALQVCGITALLGGAAVTVRRFIGAQVELDATRDQLRRVAVSEARSQFARDLHDKLGQQLTASIMQAELLAMDLDAGAIDDARAHSKMVLASSRESLDLMREMVTEVREPHLRSEVAIGERVLSASGITCEVVLDEAPVPEEVDRTLGWVVREGVTNILRHSHAAHADISTARENGMLTLVLSDDGCGLGSNGCGSGLSHMRERLGAIGGWLSLDDKPGGGCTLRASLPVSR